ncbi:hypothetical protein FCM35_KLT01588 [Carex littledalei]|uniref:Uncharacterized protein n=1 Tax=Carex littledalei TaxID=544730 RepID=A0A833VCF8_9POAL|nr:hypothetical protein FCM35_KLT01588 [Carex littledalei]
MSKTNTGYTAGEERNEHGPMEDVRPRRGPQSGTKFSGPVCPIWIPPAHINALSAIIAVLFFSLLLSTSSPPLCAAVKRRKGLSRVPLPLGL